MIACSASYLKAIVHRGLLLARAQPFPLVQVVDLDDQSIGLEIQGVATALPVTGVLDHLGDRVVAPGQRTDRDAPALEQLGDPEIGRLTQALALSQTVRDEPKPALGTDPGVQELERAGRGIARVLERLFPLGQPQCVDSRSSELGMNTSPRTSSSSGGSPLRVERYLADGAQVGGDVVASLAVAAGRP